MNDNRKCIKKYAFSHETDAKVWSRLKFLKFLDFLTRAEYHVRFSGLLEISLAHLLYCSGLMTNKYKIWSVELINIFITFSSVIWVSDMATQRLQTSTSRERPRFSDQRLLPLETPSATRYISYRNVG